MLKKRCIRHGAIVLSILILGLANISNIANAGTLKLVWTNPQYNADSLNCMKEDSTSILYDLRGVQIQGTRFKDGSTVDFGEVPAMAGGLDSVLLYIQDGTMGELLFRTVDINNNKSCLPYHYVFAIPATEVVTQVNGLTGQYYTGTNLNTHVFDQVDTTINFNWGNSPAWSGGPTDNFSIKWFGKITIPTSGNWTFYVGSDDGIRLYIDGALVQDYWISRWAETSNTIQLSAGVHNIRLEYFEGSGGALCILSWAGPNVSRQVIPKMYFMP